MLGSRRQPFAILMCSVSAHRDPSSAVKNTQEGPEGPTLGDIDVPPPHPTQTSPQRVANGWLTHARYLPSVPPALGRRIQANTDDTALDGCFLLAWRVPRSLTYWLALIAARPQLAPCPPISIATFPQLVLEPSIASATAGRGPAAPDRHVAGLSAHHAADTILAAHKRHIRGAHRLPYEVASQEQATKDARK